MVLNLLSLEQEVARASGQASTTQDIQIRDLTSNQKFFILNGSLFSVAHRFIYLEIIKKKGKTENKCCNAITLSAPSKTDSASTDTWVHHFFAFITFNEPQQPNTSQVHSWCSCFLHVELFYIVF